MNRLLETHCDDAQFSQTRLLDEDEDLRKELKSIRVCRNVQWLILTKLVSQLFCHFIYYDIDCSKQRFETGLKFFYRFLWRECE